jgi:hypothetical protein
VSGCIIPNRFRHSEIIYKERKPYSKLTIKKILDTRQGCSAVIAEKHSYHKISYRISYYADTVKKQSYYYCSRGALIDVHTYVATEEEISPENYKVYNILSSSDKFVLNKIDSLIHSEGSQQGKPPAYKKEICGFKLVSGRELGR